jgi:hypothetical protein
MSGIDTILKEIPEHGLALFPFGRVSTQHWTPLVRQQGMAQLGSKI